MDKVKIITEDKVKITVEGYHKRAIDLGLAHRCVTVGCRHNLAQHKGIKEPICNLRIVDIVGGKCLQRQDYDWTNHKE